ncbi:MAG: alpha-2-macroglobulin family protein [Clostridiales bacterium]|nr:alpha-2-macroglobulin family protein [Clostridiales bacterium]
MGKIKFTSVLMTWLFIAFVFVLTLQRCKQEEPGKAGQSARTDKIDRAYRDNINNPLKPPPAAAVTDLRVLSATPQGRTAAPHESETVVVTFDRPMVALQAIEKKAPLDRSLLRFDPPAAGKHRWIGSRTLAFAPDKRFPFASEINVTVPAGTSALDGSTLPRDFIWSFKTIEPRLVRNFPVDGQRWVKLDTQVLLLFNQPIDRDKAARFISWTEAPTATACAEPGRPRALPFDIAHPPAEKLKSERLELPPDHGLLLTLSSGQKLTPGSTCLITLKRGLAAKEGPLGLEKDHSFSFETFAPFRFIGLENAENLPPSEPVQFKFTNQVFYKDFVSKITFDPPVEIPDYYSEWEYSSDVLYFSLPLEPDSSYSVRLSPDLADEFGNSLGEAVSLRFSTGSFPPSVSMVTGHGVIEATIAPGPRYPLQAINQESVFIQATRLAKDAVIPLLRQPKVFWPDEKFSAPAGFFQVEKTLNLNLGRNKRRTVPIDLSELFPAPNTPGLLFLQVDTNCPEDKWDRYKKAFLQVTELGISAKFSADNNIIWVTELKTGLPVPDAAVELRDDANTVKWRGKTDAFGKAETPGWKKLGISSRDEYAEPRQWVFASRGADTALSSSEWGTGIDPYRFRISYDWFPEPAVWQGYIFTERGIYRAGEKVHIKGIIRESVKGQWQIPSAPPPASSPLSLDCEILDPFEKRIFKSTIPLDKFGSFALDFTTSEDSSLGYYQITAKLRPRLPGEKPVLFSGSFRVEAFRPAEFELHLRAAEKSFVFSRDYRAEIRANYLFGGAMAGQDVTWHLRLNRTSFAPPGHEGYIFGNEIDWGEEETSPAESRLLASAETRLNDQGKLTLKVPLLPEKEKDSVLATLEATVTSPSRRTISNRIQTLVHRGEFTIGLKPSTSFLKKGEAISVDVIAALPDGTLLPGRTINLKLVRREWRSVRQAGVGGLFRWLTEREDVEVESRDVLTGMSAATVSLAPDKSGFYLLLASSLDSLKNTITTTTSFYVTGRDFVPWERTDDDAIELVADAESYRPGDRARILVKSPYERAKALVTIERESILEARVLDIEGTASHIEIPILREYIPNVFISVLLVYGRVETSAVGLKDLGQPSFKIGYVNLSVNPALKRLSVSIENPRTEYKPRETVRLKFRVSASSSSDAGLPACLSVAVVDLGVLNLIGYETPDPFSFFYGERPLSVRTSETRLHVVGQRDYGEKGEEPGGGVGTEKEMAAAPGLTEVELRGDFKSTAYWNPSLLTDENGEASVTFTLPDNLTTFRVMAVAQTRESHFGRSETSFRVSKKLLLLPSFPRFCRVGDMFEAGVVIHNFSSVKGDVNLGVEASGIRLLDKTKARRFILKHGESREVLFRLEADRPGVATFSFRGRLADETDGVELKLPVYLPRPTETVALSGETEEAAEEKVLVPDDVYPEESRLEVHAASSALLSLKGSFDYLTDYPYACLEQRLSAILPYVVARRVLVDFKLTSLQEKDIDILVRKGLNEVAAFQKENGGFSSWPDSSFESPFLTCYAAFTLIQAQEAGFEVDRDRLDRAAGYLISFLRTEWSQGRQPFGQRAWKTTRAYALYVLSLLGKPQPAFAERLYAEKDRLSLFARTLLLKALHHGKGSPAALATLLQDLLNKIKVSPSGAHFEDDEGSEGRWIYSSNSRTTALILQTLIETGQDHPLLGSVARWLVSKQRESSGRFGSTQENFYVFYGLNEFYSSRERVPADFIGKVTLAGRTLLEERFSSASREIKTARFGFREFKTRDEDTTGGQRELPLRIRKEGEGILYYGARLTYAPARPGVPRDEGIAVVKKIEPLDRGGKPTETIKAGSLVVVTVEVAVPQESLYVVVDDPLPAGFDAVNPNFITESEEAARRLGEIIASDSTPSPWWHGFSHIEMHDDRVLLFADSLAPGLHTHRYLARALNFGAYVLPGTKAEEMYSPEVFGRSQETLVNIVK